MILQFKINLNMYTNNISPIYSLCRIYIIKYLYYNLITINLQKIKLKFYKNLDSFYN